jgi:NAD(P)-dependent dehydrogenase (short-subunit alcohol dehydrogenase family)
MKTSIVTGASRGLGLGIATQLVAAGHDVLAVARTAPRVHGARNLAADITTDARRIVEEAGEIGLLVNNAGALPVLDALETLTVERFARGFEVDVFGTLAMTQAALPRMRGGVVVNVIAARFGIPTGPAHLSISPSQSALTSLTRNLAAILAPDITVHGLAPHITPAGATGRTAAPALGIEFGADHLTAEQVGDAVLTLAGERHSALWTVDAAQLSMVTSVPIGV